MGKFRPLPEPIRLQDLLNSARSRTEKKIKNSYSLYWVELARRILSAVVTEKITQEDFTEAMLFQQIKRAAG